MKENDLLLKVYIGQEINFSRGILYEFKGQLHFNETEKEIIDSLIEQNFVRIIYPYTIKSMRTLVTTKAGTDVAKTLIQRMITTDSELLNVIEHAIPRKVLGFLLINLDHNAFQETETEWIFDWKDYVLHNKKMFNFCIKFCRILQKRNLAVLTNDYVSSKGGRIDPKKYVIPNEIREHLTTNLRPIPFSDGEINRSILFYTIYLIKNSILPIHDDTRRRNRFWNLLRVLPFDESAIKSLIDRFRYEEITTEYSGIGNEEFPFRILDESRFEAKLSKLVGNFISEIIKGETKKPATVLSKTVQPLKTHSKLFILIVGFEMRFRNYLLNEMRAIFKEDEKAWYDQLKEIKLAGNQSPFKTIYDKLESRRNDDLKNKILPEDELISYADITDYKNIILKNWGIFESKLKRAKVNKEKFEHGMNEINKIRRKVMHLRDVRPFEEKTLRLFIIPELEKIFQ